MAGDRPRRLAVTVRRALERFPAVLVTGARQSGKTTLLRTEFGELFAYIPLERPDVRARALPDPLGFLAEHAAPLILDEIQYAPELLHYLQGPDRPGPAPRPVAPRRIAELPGHARPEP